MPPASKMMKASRSAPTMRMPAKLETKIAIIPTRAVSVAHAPANAAYPDGAGADPYTCHLTALMESPRTMTEKASWKKRTILKGMIILAAADV